MRIFAILVLLLLLLATPISAAPSTAEKFAVTNVVTAVSVSPDGKFLALIDLTVLVAPNLTAV